MMNQVKYMKHNNKTGINFLSVYYNYCGANRCIRQALLQMDPFQWYPLLPIHKVEKELKRHEFLQSEEAKQLSWREILKHPKNLRP